MLYKKHKVLFDAPFLMAQDHWEGREAEEEEPASVTPLEVQNEILPGTCWPTVMATPLTLHVPNRRIK